jgi:hypothetical protein
MEPQWRKTAPWRKRPNLMPTAKALAKVMPKSRKILNNVIIDLVSDARGESELVPGDKDVPTDKDVPMLMLTDKDVPSDKDVPTDKDVLTDKDAPTDQGEQKDENLPDVESAGFAGTSDKGVQTDKDETAGARGFGSDDKHQSHAPEDPVLVASMTRDLQRRYDELFATFP